MITVAASPRSWAARARLDAARLRFDARKKALIIGLDPRVTGSNDTIEIRLIADVGRFVGAFRLVPRAFGPVPSLPRVTRGTGVRAFVAMLTEIGVSEFGGVLDPSGPAWLGELLSAARSCMRGSDNSDKKSADTAKASRNLRPAGDAVST